MPRPPQKVLTGVLRSSWRSSWSTSSYLCAGCARKVGLSTSATRTADSQSEAFTSRLRKRIWGTESPPGQVDPYGKDGAIMPREASQVTQSVPSKKPEITDPNYEPATTWDGVESVGGYGKWWLENWDPEHPVKSFVPAERTSDAYAVTAALHRSVVEVFAFRKAGRPLSEISRISMEDLTGEAQITASTNGTDVTFPDAEIMQSIIESAVPVEEEASQSEQDLNANRSPIDPLRRQAEETAIRVNPTESEADVTADRSREDVLRMTDDALASLNHQAQIASWNPSWLQISLQDPSIKFAVVKRTFQLTGIMVPDVALRSVDTIQALLSQLVAKPKLRKLAEQLELKEELTVLPNVKISGRRVTPIDRQVGVGRWKVIEKELEARDLPVTGHD